MNDELVLSIERPDSEVAQTLMRNLDADLLKRYPHRRIHGLHTDDIVNPDFIFAVARIGTQPIGCGALRKLEQHIGEVKRMYVVPAFRGRGFSRQILLFLEATASRQGYSILRLETGIKQQEAINLYRSVGYRQIPCFGEYEGSSQSICFEKQLQ